MIETYLEQNVVLDDENRNKKKKIIFKILMYINLLIGIIAFFLMFYFIFDAEGNWMPVLWIVFVVMIPIVFFVSFFFLRRFVLSINPEYDYILNGSKFIIVRIINKNKRKKHLVLEVSEFNEIGKVTLPSYENVMRSKLKEYNACANVSEDNYYLTTRYNGERCLVYLELNEAMITAINRTLGRNIVLKK